MTAYGSPVGRRLFAELGPQPTSTDVDLIAPAFHTAHDTEIGADDTVTVVRRGSFGGRPLNGPAVAAWCRDIAELRRIAGAAPTTAPDDGDDTATGWLRRKARNNT